MMASTIFRLSSGGNFGQPLLGILLLLVLVLALVAYIVIDYYEHRVRSDMQVLVGHVNRTPQ